MEPVHAAIRESPALLRYFTGKTWESLFTAKIRNNGGGYANRATIDEIVHGYRRAGFFNLQAKVRGSRAKPYLTELSFRRAAGGWRVATYCSCPFAYDCKHAWALLELLSSELAPAAAANAGLSATAGRPPLDPAAARWLRLLRDAGKAGGTSTGQAPYSKFLAYCIATHPGHEPLLVLRLGNRLKNGGFTFDRSSPTADVIKPAKYMADTDILLVTLYRQIERVNASYPGVRLEGPGCGKLLRGALDAGRLFHSHWNDFLMEESIKLLAEGPAETVTAGWQTLPADGTTRPILELPRDGLTLLPAEPPFYVDVAAGFIGPVKSELPAAVLAAWGKGPPIPLKAIPALTEELVTIPNRPLPPPVELRREVRPAHPPAPHLHLTLKQIASYQGLIGIICGIPSFRYGDSPPLAPLGRGDEPVCSRVSGSVQTIWPRDASAETKHLRTLGQAGLIPLANLTPPAMLEEPLRHAMVVAEPRGAPRLAWIQLLAGPAFDALRTAGWTIEADRDLDLDVHDPGDFAPEIESESSHGIDWFRFDMTFEIDGEKLSLIPYIAAAIGANHPSADSPDLPEFIFFPRGGRGEGQIRFPARRLMEIVDQVRHLFLGNGGGEGPLRLDRLAAAGVADALGIDATETSRALARLARGLKTITSLPEAPLPAGLRAELRPYQLEGYRWLRFLAAHGLHGILADDMGLGKTLQTLAHLAAGQAENPGAPSLVIAPTSVVPNWAAEAARFTPDLKVLTLHGKDRADNYTEIEGADLVLTSYPLLARDFEVLAARDWHHLVLDEAQSIKNPKSITAQCACKLKAAHRLCLSGTPMENHLGELWSLMRFLMPGLLGDEKTFNSQLRKPIERDRSAEARLSLGRRVSPLILRRTKDQVAAELPAKTRIIHHVDLNKGQSNLYEAVRASMDQRVREAISAKGLAKSHIIVLDALLKLRQICCHPQLLKSAAVTGATDSAKLDFLTGDLLPQLLEEGRRILLFSQFTSMLALIEAHLEQESIPFLKLTGQSTDRAGLVKTFQTGTVPVFLISLKAGGTGLNLTAADTVIHYDPWWNPAAENQATDRAHRIGQTKPVFVHKLVCRGTIEDRILELQEHKSALVEALLSEETSRLRIDAETLSHLLAPLE
jgi:hypothetical protein